MKIKRCLQCEKEFETKKGRYCSDCTKGKKLAYDRAWQLKRKETLKATQQ